jgi:hypothetical protein
MISGVLVVLFVLARSYADSIQLRIPRRLVVFQVAVSELLIGDANIGAVLHERTSDRAARRVFVSWAYGAENENTVPMPLLPPVDVVP